MISANEAQELKENPMQNIDDVLREIYEQEIRTAASFGLNKITVKKEIPLTPSLTVEASEAFINELKDQGFTVTETDTDNIVTW